MSCGETAPVEGAALVMVTSESVWVCVYVCVCVCVCVNVCVHVVCECVCERVFVHVCEWVYVHG